MDTDERYKYILKIQKVLQNIEFNDCMAILAETQMKLQSDYTIECLKTEVEDPEETDGTEESSEETEEGSEEASEEDLEAEEETDDEEEKEEQT